MIREAFGTAAFTTDLMVGFPGESEEDFRLTADFVREARFIDAHVFAYSRREGTAAADFPNQIDEAVKRARSEELIRIKNEVRDSVLSEIVERGEPLSVILESYDGQAYTAHSEGFAEVRVPSTSADEGGKMLLVRPVLHKNGIITAKPIDEK